MPRKSVPWGSERGQPRSTYGGMYVLGVGRFDVQAAVMREELPGMDNEQGEDDDGEDDVYLYGDLARPPGDRRVSVDVDVEEEGDFAGELGVVGGIQARQTSMDVVQVRETARRRREVEVIVIEDDENKDEERCGGGQEGDGMGVVEEKKRVGCGVAEEDWMSGTVLEDFEALGNGVKSKHGSEREMTEVVSWYDDDRVEADKGSVGAVAGDEVMCESEMWDIAASEGEAGDDMQWGNEDSYRYVGEDEAAKGMQSEKDDSYTGAREGMQCGDDATYTGDNAASEPLGPDGMSHGSDMSAGRYLDGLDVDVFFADDADTTQSQHSSNSASVTQGPACLPPTYVSHYSVPDQLINSPIQRNSPRSTNLLLTHHSISNPPDRPSSTHRSHPPTPHGPPSHRTPLYPHRTHHNLFTPRHPISTTRAPLSTPHNHPSTTTPRMGIHASITRNSSFGSLPCSLDAHLAAMPNFALDEMDSEDEEDPATPQLQVCAPLHRAIFETVKHVKIDISAFVTSFFFKYRKSACVALFLIYSAGGSGF